MNAEQTVRRSMVSKAQFRYIISAKSSST